MRHSSLTISCIVLAAVGFRSVQAEQSCAELGFADTLTCDRCETLEKYTSNAQIVKECQRCCSNVISKDEVYDRAMLLVSKDSIKYFDEVQQFIDMYSKSIPNFKVKYSSLAYSPVLKLRRKVAQDEARTRTRTETFKVNIAQWKRDDIKDYLDSHIRKGES